MQQADKIKRGRRFSRFMLKVKEILFIIAYVFISLVGLTLIKIGAQGDEKEILQIVGFRLTPKLIAGTICYGASFLLYMVTISQMQISLAMPIAAAINSVGIVIIGLWIFHEHLAVGQIIGIMIVIIGTMIIGIFSK